MKKSGKYDLQKLKKDALGSLTAVGWIFPLALAFGSNSPFGAAAGLVGATVACIIGPYVWKDLQNQPLPPKIKAALPSWLSAG